MAAATSSTPSAGGPVSASVKVPATATATDESTTTADRPPPATRVTSSSTTYHRPARPARPLGSDFLSDRATAALIRRTLCARHLADRGRDTPAPIHDLLPPLTSRNDVDLQLYALLSIILREFVQNWYNKITPDETFVAEIVQIIAHCTRALEQRLRKVDLESLLFDELPELLNAHIRAYRVATTPTSRPPLKTNRRQVYHSLCPLPALSPVPQPGEPESVKLQSENESTHRHLLVQGILAVLLPTEDLENECLTSLVGQLLSELVIGNLVATRLSEPWLVWEILIMLTRLAHKTNNREEPGRVPDESVAASTFTPNIHMTTGSKREWSFDRTFWSFVHWVFLFFGAVRLVISTIARSRSLPLRSSHSVVRSTGSSNQEAILKQTQTTSHESPFQPQSHQVPLVDVRLWSCMSTLLEIDLRMPWLHGTLSMLQWITMKGPGKVAGFNGELDRLLSHYVHIHVLDPAHLPPLLRAIRAALFPNNAPGSPSLTPPSSDEQLAALRRRCASALWGLIPKRVGKLYYSTSSWAYCGVRSKVITNDESARLRAEALGSVAHIDGGPIDHDTDRDSNGIGAKPPPVWPSSERKAETPTDATSTSSGIEGGSREPDASADDTELRSHDEEEAKILSEIEHSIVDMFSDAYCNKHLIYNILELLLVRLIPELAERGVGELWAERLA